MDRTIEATREYKRDFRRAFNGQYQDAIIGELPKVLYLLSTDQPLPEKYRDHQLTGDMKDIRDCHIKPDLVLLYRKVDDLLRLVRLGSHSDLRIG